MIFLCLLLPVNSKYLEWFVFASFFNVSFIVWMFFILMLLSCDRAILLLLSCLMTALCLGDSVESSLILFYEVLFCENFRTFGLELCLTI